MCNFLDPEKKVEKMHKNFERTFTLLFSIISPFCAIFSRLQLKKKVQKMDNNFYNLYFLYDAGCRVMNHEKLTGFPLCLRGSGDMWGGAGDTYIQNLVPTPWLGGREDFEIQILSNTPEIDFGHIFRRGHWHLQTWEITKDIRIMIEYVFH